MLIRLCSFLAGATILVVKGWGYAQQAGQGWSWNHAARILLESNLFLVRLIAALTTSLGLLAIGCILVMYAVGPASLRAKAARLLGRLSSDCGLIIVLLVLLLFAVLFR